MEYTLNLNDYERDNLLQLLRLIMSSQGPLSGANTGDWVGQIRWKLKDEEGPGRPNISDDIFLKYTQSERREPNNVLKGIL